MAVWIKKDNEIEKDLTEIIYNDEKLKKIKENIIKFRKPNAAKEICKIIFEE